MVDGARRDALGNEADEHAIADELRGWIETWRGDLSMRELGRMLDIGRGPLTQALDARITGRRPWRRGGQQSA